MSELGVEAQLRNKLKKIRRSRKFGDYQTKKEEKLLEWVLAVLAARRRHLQDFLYQVNESLKIIQDEIERDSFRDLQELFDRMFDEIQTFERNILKVLE